MSDGDFASMTCNDCHLIFIHIEGLNKICTYCGHDNNKADKVGFGAVWLGNALLGTLV